MHFLCVIGLGLLGLSQTYKQQLSIFCLTDMVNLMQYCYISCFCFMFLSENNLSIRQIITSSPTGWGIALDKVNILLINLDPSILGIQNNIRTI